MKILIVGCGPAGLGAACRIHEYLEKNPQEKVQVKIIDRESHPGGLSCTVYDSHGFGWDCGVHITFSAFDFYNQILNKAIDTWIIHKREVFIDLTSRFGARYPYPIQKSIAYFPEDVRQNCINDIRTLWQEKEKSGTNGSVKLQNFKQFCLLGFGPTLCDIFFKPYNEKIWSTPFDQLSAEWVSDRVAPVDLKDLEKKPEPVNKNDDKSKIDHGWGPNAVFRYPNQGGTGFIWRSVANLLPSDWFSYKKELTRVDLTKKIAEIKNMKTNELENYEYDYLITTIPLDLFGRLCVNPKLEPNLRHTSVVIVGVAVEDRLPECLSEKSWLYFPDDSPYYRVTILSYYFSNCTPDNNRYYSLLCEISMVPPDPGHKIDLDGYTQRTVDRLVEQGLIVDANKVHHTHTFLLPYGYPIPTMDRNAELRKAHAILEEKQVYSRGRFGGWKYEASNQDFSFMQGAEAAGFILEGTPEKVYTWR